MFSRRLAYAGSMAARCALPRRRPRRSNILSVLPATACGRQAS